jgi:bacillithiol synthase
MNLRIEVGAVPGPALVTDYLGGAAALAPFFSGFPFDLEAYRRKAREVDARFAAGQRAGIAAAIRAPTAAAAARLDRVVAENGFFVTTGQQPGLFGGPLYTVYKALSAVRLAERLEEALGRPVAPLFWTASNDHDWDEANHIVVVDPANALHRLTLAAADARPLPLAQRALGPELEALLDGLEALLPDSEFRGEAIARLRQAYRPERTVAAAFAEWIEWLLAPAGLLFIDASEPQLRQQSAPVLRREVEESARHETLLVAQTERLRAAGYHAQVQLSAGAANVFHEDAEGRERLLRQDDGGWVLRHTGRRFEHEELLALLDAEPHRFSPNVLLRPVVESALLPTLAYVGGPGEVAYFAQLGCLFDAHGLEMPIVFPRFSVLLIERKIEKVLDKLQLDADAFRRPVQEVAARVLRDEMPEGVGRAVAEIRAALEGGYGRLIDAALPIDATLRTPLQSARNSSFVALDDAEKKIAQHLKKQNAIVVEQIEKAAHNLYPFGQPQERVLNVLQFLVRYGPELLDAIGGEMTVALEAVAPEWGGVRCGAGTAAGLTPRLRG